MSRSIFDHAKSVCIDKTPWHLLSEEDQKSWNTFMVNKILSMNPDYLEVVDMIQIRTNLPPSAVHTLYCEFLPKGYRFLPLLKKGGSNDEIKAIAKYYQVSKREARDYIKLLDAKQVAVITQEYLADPFQAKKIKKTK